MTTETADSNTNPNPSSSSASGAASGSASSSHPSSFLLLSRDVAAVVAAASPYAAQIDGGRRLSASGTVFAGDGVIVAASHNVERDEDVVVGLEGGKRLPATLVGRDSSTDLAVLRVEASGLAAPQWSDLADLAGGQLAVLVGRPGRQVRAALAMISDVRDSWRSPAGAKLERYVELDAARERGFSGSVVVDAGGRPLGIASSGLLRRRGLVVPGVTLRRGVQSLLANARVRRGFLGIGAYPVRLQAVLEGRAASCRWYPSRALDFLFRSKRRERLRGTPLSAEQRAIVRRNVPYVSTLSAEDQRELEGHMQVFLAEKRFEGCGGLAMTEEIRLTIAAHACVLLLHRETDYYSGLGSILVYPSAYVVRGTRQKLGDLVVESDQVRLGESWVRGAVVLACDAVQRR